MTNEQMQQLGKDLFQVLTTKKRLPMISETYPEIEIADSYKIQSYMVQEYKKAGYHSAGRKIGITSQAMRDLVNINEPDYGSIFWENYFVNGTSLNRDDFMIPRVEVEFLYKLKAPLDHGPVTKQMVLDASEYVVAGIEVIDNRIMVQGLNICDSIADNASFGAFTLGDNPRDPHEMDMRCVGVVVEKNNKQVATASGAAVMSDSTNGIVWLANKMIELGEPLQAGEIVLAGSVIAAVPAEKGDYFRASFGELGEVSVSFK